MITSRHSCATPANCSWESPLRSWGLSIRLRMDIGFPTPPRTAKRNADDTLQLRMPNTLKIGSPEHKELLCRTFINTHDPFKPAEIRWPDLDPESLQRLKAMPVWNEATRTEAATAVKVKSLGDTETDPFLAEAIRLQGYEEGRHAEVLMLLTRHYGIEVAPFAPPEVPKDPTRA